jgi:hypothetical protein
MTPKYTGPPMTLGNMRRQGVQHLIAFCLNDANVLKVTARGTGPAYQRSRSSQRA